MIVPHYFIHLGNEATTVHDKVLHLMKDSMHLEMLEGNCFLFIYFLVVLVELGIPRSAIIEVWYRKVLARPAI